MRSHRARSAWLLALLAGASGLVVACVGGEPSPSGSSGAGEQDSGPVNDGGLTQDSPPNDRDGEPSGGEDGGDVVRLVFVTSAQVGAAFAAGSAPWAAADALCATEADANSLPGTFVAWLSFKNESATAFNAGSRIANAAYYVPAPAGDPPVLAFASKAELFSTGPRVPLDRLPNGQQVPQNENSTVAWAWTGTDASGNATGNDCNAWTTTGTTPSDPLATIGNARLYAKPTASDWTMLNTRPCDPAYVYRLYCFQK